MTTEIKETVRRFTVTTEIVVNTKDQPYVTDDGIKEGIKVLLSRSFEGADPNTLLNAEITDVEERAL